MGENYKLVQFVDLEDKPYGAISSKYLDSEGKLNQELNGLQMHISSCIDGCISNIKFEKRYESLINSGVSKWKALALASGIDTYEIDNFEIRAKEVCDNE